MHNQQGKVIINILKKRVNELLLSLLTSIYQGKTAR